VIDLSSEIVSPERDTEQEPHPGHDAVAIADAQPALDQMKLEAADIIRASGVGRALQECREPLAAVDVAPVRMPPELARGHVLDHALTQWADGFRTHG
jgi:hypothetical protein